MDTDPLFIDAELYADVLSLEQTIDYETALELRERRSGKLTPQPKPPKQKDG
jgi:hypothetical protein